MVCRQRVKGVKMDGLKRDDADGSGLMEKSREAAGRFGLEGMSGHAPDYGGSTLDGLLMPIDGRERRRLLM